MVSVSGGSRRTMSVDAAPVNTCSTLMRVASELFDFERHLNTYHQAESAYLLYFRHIFETVDEILTYFSRVFNEVFLPR